MKKLLILYLILTSKMFSIEQSIKYYLELPLNPKCEAMGSTGMIFGKIPGSLYLAPTSILQRKLRKYNKIDIRINGEVVTSFRNDILFNVYFRLYNFSAGAFSNYTNSQVDNKLGEDTKLIAPFLSIPLQYSFEFKKFSFGLGIMYNYHMESIFHYLHLLSLKFNGMYKSDYGNFSLSLNNFLSTSYKEKIPLKDSYYENSIYLKKNLRLGYGKEFILNYLFNRMQIALELDNLLMDSIYLNHNEKDYILFRKFHLGICAIKDIENNGLELRVGFKNLFPTFGIEFNIRDTFKIEYAFTNIDLGKEWGEKRKIINILSIRLEGSEYF